jgi:hypothetical protein
VTIFGFPQLLRQFHVHPDTSHLHLQNTEWIKGTAAQKGLSKPLWYQPMHSQGHRPIPIHVLVKVKSWHDQEFTDRPDNYFGASEPIQYCIIRHSLYNLVLPIKSVNSQDVLECGVVKAHGLFW